MPGWDGEDSGGFWRIHGIREGVCLCRICYEGGCGLDHVKTKRRCQNAKITKENILLILKEKLGHP